MTNRRLKGRFGSEFRFNVPRIFFYVWVHEELSCCSALGCCTLSCRHDTSTVFSGKEKLIVSAAGTYHIAFDGQRRNLSRAKDRSARNLSTFHSLILARRGDDAARGRKKT